MANFSEFFDLGLRQAELDFVDVDLDTDTPLYLCPYAIQQRNDEWSQAAGDCIRSFFNEVLNLLRNDDQAAAAHILSNLHEPNETFLGESEGYPQGRGMGIEKARDLVDAMVASRAFETGVLGDIAEAELFIRGVGRDMISDITTNVIRGLLLDYTSQQCQLHRIQMEPAYGLGPVWDIAIRNWRATNPNLPNANGRPVLLVPKSIVRKKLSLNSREFYDHFLIEFYRAEYLHAGGALVTVFKNGRRDVFKKHVKEIHPFSKNNLADFVFDHPEILEEYKNRALGRGQSFDNYENDEINEVILAEILINRLNDVCPGNETATHYHKLASAICTFLFHPYLQAPVIEFEQQNGRKRVDIKFTNAAEEGFFFRMLAAAQTRATSIFVECKNYSRDVANPELDQLSGRFGHQRGFFGFLLCRTIDNSELLEQRCRDAANDQRGYMIALADDDLKTLLGFVRVGRRDQIDQFLSTKFDRLVN